MLFVYIYAGNSKDTMGIASVDYARGMITLLFAVGTVVIALLLTLSAIFPTADDGGKAKERFERGKEVLSLLIGIFGTIIGFYFGSISAKPADDNTNKTTSQIHEQVPAQKAAPSTNAGGTSKVEQPAIKQSTTLP